MPVAERLPQETPYRICNRCVMDSSDPDIRFDASGQCNHCDHALKLLSQHTHSAAKKKARLDRLVSEIQRAGAGKTHDCVVGISGGVDSTFTTLMAHKLGLRPLAVHFDNGWNDTRAVSNIANTLQKCGIDLHTYVVDWEEFRDLQLSFLKSSTPDCEIPTDHGITACLFDVAASRGIRHILFGTNVMTESILPRAWSHGHLDWKYISSVHSAFGTRPLPSFPHLSFWKRRLYEIKRIRWVSFLDYLDYNKAEAIRFLEAEVGWTTYGGKHCESIYTRFYQNYFLPLKFGFDKRRAHLSSLICAGQISRHEGLIALQKPPYEDPRQERLDKEYVLRKLRLTEEDFSKLVELPPQEFDDFPSYEKLEPYRSLDLGLQWLKRIKDQFESRG